jgi:hypothetical protein
VIQQERWEKDKAHAKHWGAEFKECQPPWAPRTEPPEPEEPEKPEKSDQIRPSPAKSDHRKK